MQRMATVVGHCAVMVLWQVWAQYALAQGGVDHGGAHLEGPGAHERRGRDGRRAARRIRSG